MPNYEKPRQHEEIEKTADGRYLLLRRPGLSPLEYGDDNLYSLEGGMETVFWLLTAAGSGVVGNLAYDALKQIIEKAREKNQKVLDRIGHWNRREELLQADYPTHRRRPADPALITPDRDLRDDLVEITYDVLSRYRQLGHGRSQGRFMSEISVFFTEDMTWGVRTRELRVSHGTYVEIDLREDTGNKRYRALAEIDGFPVRIWS